MPGVPKRDTTSDWMALARNRLALRRAEKPATKAGQIRALWPEIEAALEVGQTVRSICKWLEEDAGIVVGITSLTSYISRIRRRESATQRAQGPLPLKTIAVNRSAAPGSAQPCE